MQFCVLASTKTRLKRYQIFHQLSEMWQKKIQAKSKSFIGCKAKYFFYRNCGALCDAVVGMSAPNTVTCRTPHPPSASLTPSPSADQRLRLKIEIKVHSHTVPQEWRKRPELNSINDCARHFFQFWKMHSKVDFDPDLSIYLFLVLFSSYTW